MKNKLTDSSCLLRTLLEKPCIHGKPSIDMLSFTIPFSNDVAKKLLGLQRFRCAMHEYKLKELDNNEIGAHKYKREITVRFSNNSFAYIFLFGLNSKQNPVRIQFNPNIVGLDNVALLLSEVKKLVGKTEYEDHISNSNVTRVDYTLDLPGFPFEHLIVDYSYRTRYKCFQEKDGVRFTGFQYGPYTGCPLKFYDKARESGGEYQSFTRYTRIEKMHKPRARGRKSMFKIEVMDKQRYGFQGLSLYDPRLLTNMPEKVLNIIRMEGLSKAQYLVSDKNRATLQKRMAKHKIKLPDGFKQTMTECYQHSLSEIKQVVVDPDNKADEYRKHYQC